ncbi:MAG: aminopeptidase [Thermomicrobiales bacterium]|nr:aminopeptidase [Thermomicrobiales bacterium]
MDRWADLLTGYCTDVRPGQQVAISGELPAQPLIEATSRAVMRAGGHPVVLPVLPGLDAMLHRSGMDEQISFISPVERFAREEADVSIRILADENTRGSSTVDPARSMLWRRARRELNQRFAERAANGELRWSLTLFPTPAFAQDAGMSTDEYTDFIFRACKLHEPDPAEAWRALRARQSRIIDWLEPRQELHLVGPGTDLRVAIGGRSWINSDGSRNLLSGEVFTGPVEDSAEGEIACSFPVVTGGREIAGIRLKFASGVVVDASAARNEDYLLSALDSDEGARRLGEIAIGTNTDIDRFTGQILLDEKIGGTAHLALGQGYPETGSTNRSAIHWDLIVDLREGGRVEADGQPLVVNGDILIR